MTTTATRIHNFSAGPCTLPLPVLEQLADEMADYQGQGMGLVEMSHRSGAVQDVFARAKALVEELLGVPDSHTVVFLAGGATAQFGLIPMNFRGAAQTAEYLHTGAWAKKAIADAKACATEAQGTDVIWSGEDSGFTTLPDPASLKVAPDAAYLHVCTNETIGGIRFAEFPDMDGLGAPDVPLIGDMSSEIMSRPVDVAKFGMIYAGAQKNLAPAGVTLCIFRKDLLERCPRTLPGWLNYAKHAAADSMLNTPPVWQVRALELVLAWLQEQGGLAWAEQAATQRSGKVYDAIEGSGGFYRCPVDTAVRSPMNVVFRLPSEELEAAFIKQADAAGLSGLKGHRSVGGCRASLYNAMPLAGAEALKAFMADFAAKHG